jgi:hypothetical protein
MLPLPSWLGITGTILVGPWAGEAELNAEGRLDAVDPQKTLRHCSNSVAMA